jgi:hypothetical protein
MRQATMNNGNLHTVREVRSYTVNGTARWVKTLALSLPADLRRAYWHGVVEWQHETIGDIATAEVAERTEFATALEEKACLSREAREASMMAWYAVETATEFAQKVLRGDVTAAAHADADKTLDKIEAEECPGNNRP